MIKINEGNLGSNSIGKIKSYLRELTIVTTGVLIALFLSNLKENIQAKKYHRASVETINNEIETNYSQLKGVVEKQSNLVDTILKYNEANITIIDLFKKTNGLQNATLSNGGLELYTKNQIDLIDFGIMSGLIQMNILTETINFKLEKLSDFAYSNVFNNSRESKTMLSLHLSNLLNTEKQLLLIYKAYIDDNIDKQNGSR